MGPFWRGRRLTGARCSRRRAGWLNSVAVCLGGETPVGPFFLCAGRGSGGAVNNFLVIGAPQMH